MEQVYTNIKDFLELFFGTYTPVTYESADGVSIIASGLAGVDIPFVLGVCLFALVVYSAFRLLGGLLR